MRTFCTFQTVVYPTHGIGLITHIGPFKATGETTATDHYVISFPRYKMTLRVPVTRADDIRPISTKPDMERALKELTRARDKSRRLWSQRAVAYYADLWSGDVLKIAVLTRNLYATEEERAAGKQSYSEREIFDAAFIRLTEELAAVALIEVSVAESLVDQALETKMLPTELKKL